MCIYVQCSQTLQTIFRHLSVGLRHARTVGLSPCLMFARRPVAPTLSRHAYGGCAPPPALSVRPTSAMRPSLCVRRHTSVAMRCYASVAMRCYASVANSLCVAMRPSLCVRRYASVAMRPSLYVRRYALLCIHRYELLCIRRYALLCVRRYALLCVRRYALLCVHRYASLCDVRYTTDVHAFYPLHLLESGELLSYWH